MRWDVYIWPVNNPGNVSMIAKDVDSDTAQELSNNYFNTNLYDTYLVPTGTELMI